MKHPEAVLNLLSIFEHFSTFWFTLNTREYFAAITCRHVADSINTATNYSSRDTLVLPMVIFPPHI